eukprot:gene8430-17377_t
MEISAYEQIRQENINRNQKFLNEIGILQISKEISSSPIKPLKSNRNSKHKAELLYTEPTRRSTRNIGKSVVDYKEPSLTSIQKSQGNTKINSYISLQEDSIIDKKGYNEESDTTQYELPSRKVVKQRPSATLTNPLNCRNISPNLDIFLNHYLGKPLQSYGKAPVMTIANNNTTPTFSKYSGIAEWSNTLFLWVNLGDQTSEYKNEFLDGGRKITWFGGSRMFSDSPSTLRLVEKRFFKIKTTIHIDNNNNNSNNKEFINESTDLVVDANLEERRKPTTVILFARIIGESYTCLGVVEEESSMLNIHPIKFTWNLISFDSLIQEPYFQRMLAL